MFVNISQGHLILDSKKILLVDVKVDTSIHIFIQIFSNVRNII